MTLRFGTDGVRGDAQTDLTPPLVAALGRAAARVLGTDAPFVVGRDTRESGPRLVADLAAGVCAEGGALVDVGVLPTPAVAFLAGRRAAPAAMISASHNPFHDNGIKLFSRGGRKLADDSEAAIESVVRELVDEPRPSDASAGITRLDDALDEYVAHLVASVGGRHLDGLRVVLDCANGAASGVAPVVFRALGARVNVVHAEPDGRNINDRCGSTYPDDLRAAVIQHHADAGLAFDGDADRAIAVDERGELVDGDRILAITALDLHERGELRGDAVAITVMSNLGLRNALRAAGIGIVETPVGDRAVLAAMEQHGLGLGGEQSGHIVFGDLATTGDGILTGLLLLDRRRRAATPLSDLAAVVQPVPQLLVNVGVDELAALESTGVRAAIGEVQASLGDRGRVLVRPSGTEPVVRIMVEAPTESEAQAAVTRIRGALEGTAG